MCGNNNCGCGSHHGHKHGQHGKSCGCQQNAQFDRWLWTKEEKIAWLEERLTDLQEEVKAYEERITLLKNEA